MVDEGGDRLPCRAWIDAETGRLFEPVLPSSCTPYAKDRSFSCDGEFEIEIPAGRGIVHVERGKEYRVVEQAYEATADEDVELTIPLLRWVDMPAEGWYSADMHVHLGVNDAAVLRQLAVADDVHVTPVFTYWLRGTEGRWRSDWPNERSNQVVAVDSNHLLTRSNIEIERIRREAIPGGSVGASFLFNLQRPVSVSRFGEHFPSDTKLCLAARLHSPNVVIDTDKPSWAETVVGAAFGTYDTVQVCHNHYHRYRTIPGGYGMIGPIVVGDSNAVTDDGLFHRTNSLYYRLLNCGFRMGVSGGSAIGVMAVPMGYNRVYAKVDGPLTAQKYWAAVKSGNSFATSGPMLTLTVDGQPMGATIKRNGLTGSPVSVKAHLRSAAPIDSVQLIHDGQVVEEHVLPHEKNTDLTLSWTRMPSRSGWIATRALFRAPDGRLRQAHSSPIYIEVDNKPIAYQDDAEYMIKWVDRLLEIADAEDRFPTPADRTELVSLYASAQEIYRGVAARARDTWGD